MHQIAVSDGPLKNKEVAVGIVIALILITLGVFKMLAQTERASGQARPVQNQAVVESDQKTTTMKILEEIEAEKREKALAAIAEHEEKISANWRAKDTPDRLMAVGNLYQYQLGDYYSAIQNYRTLVGSHPNHSQTPQAYVEIAACFERIGEDVQARYVYREMLEKLDPSLQHTAYARQKLEGEVE